MIRISYYYISGRYRAWRRHWRSASKHYSKLVELKSSPSINYRLGHALMKSRKWEKALFFINKAIELSPQQKPYFFIRKSQVLINLKRYEEAKISIKSALKIDRDSYFANRVMADIYLANERWKEAIRQYEKALKLSPSSNNQRLCYLFHSIGFAYHRLGNEKSAEKFYEKAVEHDEKHKSKTFGIGALHYKRKWWQEALVAYEEELKKQPECADLHYRKGRTLDKLERPLEAVISYQKFVKLDEVLLENSHKIDKNLIIFESYMGRGYSCSPRAIYEQLRSSPEYSDYKFVWSFRKPKKFRYLTDRRTVITKYKSRNYFRYFATAKYWYSNSRIPHIDKFHPGQIYIQCWHGTPLKRLGHDIIEHTEGAKHDKNSVVSLYDSETKKFDYLLSPSSYATECFKTAFDLKNVNKDCIIIEEGYPRNDILVNHTASDIERIKKELKLPSDKKVLLYAPTWRDNQHESGTGYTYKTEADFDYLQKHLGNEWIILFRAHYFVANSFDFDKYEGFVYNVSKVNEINDLYIISDLLMTDYSSVFFDYANLGRPIIFFMYDLEQYKDDLRGFYLDIKTLPGDIVKTEKQIVKILSDIPAYCRKYSKKYQKFSKTYNYLDDGMSAQRVAKITIR